VHSMASSPGGRVVLIVNLSEISYRTKQSIASEGILFAKDLLMISLNR
jgi:hypothetical protein